MNVVIIEDEVQTAWDLEQTIKGLRPDVVVDTIIDSVESGLEWFSKNPQPDLILSDIQLGDGLAFDIFSAIEIECPVIFCTAYDEYAIEAFRHNGIDYLLKPVKDELLGKSLAKINLLNKAARGNQHASLLNQLLKEIGAGFKSYKSTFLVSFREKMIPVSVADIAFFNISDEMVQLHTQDNKQYRLNYTLDYIESVIDPVLFYRVNRQHLVAFSNIREIEHYFDRKLIVTLFHPRAEPLLVSKARASDFLKWMENR